jgi:putative acetyltransferase
MTRAGEPIAGLERRSRRHHGIRQSRPSDAARAVTIWREAVDATHHFLTPSDRDSIDDIVQQFLPNSTLWLAVDGDDQPMGFMLLDAGHMAGLFIAPAFHRAGVGRSLVEHALRLQPLVTTEVNEQNTQAVGFYERLGFTRIGWSATDDDGRPYPLINMQLRREDYRA